MFILSMSGAYVMARSERALRLLMIRCDVMALVEAMAAQLCALMALSGDMMAHATESASDMP